MRTVVRLIVAGFLTAGVVLGFVAPAHALRPVIIGGQSASIDTHPWQAMVLVGDRTLCGGALVAPGWVVTAAHCVQGVGPASVSVHAGINRVAERSDASALQVAEVLVHPQADASTYANDVALLRLATAWAPAPSRQAIAMPLGQDPAAFPPAGTAATISGWGQVVEGGASADQLQSAQVTVLADAAGPCGQYGTLYNGATHICAGAAGGLVDTCSGDSGGPLVVDVGGVPTLAGVTSVGNGCARADYPGLYTRVTAVLPWISQVADVVAGPPGVPTAVTARPLGTGTAEVTWQPAPGPAATSFTVTGVPGGAVCTTAAAPCVVTGLRPGRSFAFTVQASNAAGASGQSEPSATITATQAGVGVGASLSSAKARSLAKARSPRARVRTTTPEICRVGASRIVMRAPGTCRLTVVGGRRPVYVAVA